MRKFLPYFLGAVAIALSACATDGSFDPVKTQVNAHTAHAATAAASEIAAKTGALKGDAASKAAVALDAAETAIVTTDAALGVANDPSVVSAAKADRTATSAADKALARSR